VPGVIQNWWRQGMIGSAKAHPMCRRSSWHGDDDQIVPIADSALLSAKLLKKGILKVYENFPHGMCTTPREYGEPRSACLHRGLTGRCVAGKGEIADVRSFTVAAIISVRRLRLAWCKNQCRRHAGDCGTLQRAYERAAARRARRTGERTDRVHVGLARRSRALRPDMRQTIATSQDLREGVQSVFEKREPIFSIT
jgi:hypothetical protein